jgi:undecaprenyl-diphosphatase
MPAVRRETPRDILEKVGGNEKSREVNRGSLTLPHFHSSTIAPAVRGIIAFSSNAKPLSMSRLQQGIATCGRVFKGLLRDDFALLVGLCLIAGGLWGFAELADEVVERETQSFDDRLLLSLRNPDDLSDPVGPRWVEEMGRDFTALGGVAFLALLTLAVAGYLLLERKPHLAVFLAVTVGGGILASSLLKYGFSRPRPDLVPHGSIVYTSSFPSGHSMMAAITYLTLAVVLARAHSRRRVKTYFIAIAALVTMAVGASRVYLGVHWPTDVFAGWTAGTVWATSCWLIARRLQQRGQLESAGLETQPSPTADSQL